MDDLKSMRPGCSRNRIRRHEWFLIATLAVSFTPAFAQEMSLRIPSVVRRPALAHTHKNHVHFTSWCDRCERWTCSDCDLHCDCPPVVRPDQLPDAQRDGSMPGDAWPDDAQDLPAPSPLTDPSSDTDLPDAPGDSPDLGDFAANFGAARGMMGAPNMIGDNYGGNPSISTVRQYVRTSLQATGATFSFPGDPNGTIAYEVSMLPESNADDFFSLGTGRDEIGGPGADTFDITEPVPPSDAPTSPGPDFVFDGGVAQNPTGTYNDGDIWDVDYSFSRQLHVFIPEAGNGGYGGVVVGHLKIAENTSPLPRDRIFFNYSYFDNVPLSPSGTDVHRFTPGFERTFGGGASSIELRVPAAGTIDPVFVADAPNEVRDLEFGNLFMSFKRLIYRSSRQAVSMGFSVTLPTADDLVVDLRDGSRLVEIQNQAVHVMPFLGWLFAPNDRFFHQSFLQLDVDANGNAVRLNQNGTGLVDSGTIHGTTFLYVDTSFGYWIYQNPRACRSLIGIAPMLELHYNRSLVESDGIVTEGFQIGGLRDNVQQLNAIVAMNFQMRRCTNFSVGYTVPLGNGADQMFDGEFRFLWNRMF